MSGIHAKICGLSTAESVIAAKEAGAGYIGFVFHAASPRHISPEKAAVLCALAPAIPSVAVTVNANNDAIEAMLKHFTPAYLQLHGNESPDHAAHLKRAFGIKLIKAFAVKTAEDIARAHSWEEHVDLLMFDAKAQGLPGGNGVSFDWHLLAGQKFAKPWFLSGGLTPDNVEQAVRITGAKLVDVSSGVETAPGIKSPKLTRLFLKQVNSIRI